MRKTFILLICFALIGIVSAQDATSPYRFALARIEDAQRSGTIELSLFSLGLDELPPEIGSLTNLQVLDLSGNNLKVLPPEIGRLSNLRVLDVEFNILKALPPEIGNLTNLEVLDLSSNRLRSLPPEIGSLTNLQEFHLDNNQLSNLPPEIGNFSHLCHLDLDNNSLSYLPAEFGQLSGLEENLPCREGTSVLSLGDEIYNFPPPRIIDDGTDAILAYVREEYEDDINRRTREALWRIQEAIEGEDDDLDLSGLGLTTLPPEIWQMSNLKTLNLSGNELRAIPSEIGNLMNLERLNLMGNALRSLPSEIGNLMNLTELRVAGNELIVLPAEFGNLTKLETLYIDHNELRELPPEIASLSSLEFLIIEQNQLRSLPPEIGNMTNLRVLSLWDNQLTSLPPEIANLNISSLDLTDNLLKTLPREITNLSNLRTLALSYNLFEVLPAEIGSISSLRSLSVAYNHLSSLPPEIANLQLCYLNISENDFETLPDVLLSFAPDIDCGDSGVGIMIDDETVLEDGDEIAEMPEPSPFSAQCPDGLPIRVDDGDIAFVVGTEVGYQGLRVFNNDNFSEPVAILPLGTRFRVITAFVCVEGETTWMYIETLDGSFVGFVREGIDSETYFVAPDK